MKLKIETEQESDGRWIAEVIDLPGTMKYGKTREEAIRQVEVLTLRVIADRTEDSKQSIKSVTMDW